MKTDDLIAALAADNRSAGPDIAVRLNWAIALGAAAAFALFMVTLGPRPDIDAALGSWRFPTKIVLMALVAATALAVAARVARPGVPLSRLWPVLALAPLGLGGALAVELWSTPSGDWMRLMVGRNSVACLVAVTVYAMAPLALLLHVLRDGAPSSPAAAGAIAGLASGGIGAAFYGLHCFDDSPLFVAFWYSIPILGLVALGAALGSRLLRW